MRYFNYLLSLASLFIVVSCVSGGSVESGLVSLQIPDNTLSPGKIIPENNQVSNIVPIHTLDSLDGHIRVAKSWKLSMEQIDGFKNKLIDNVSHIYVRANPDIDDPDDIEVILDIVKTKTKFIQKSDLYSLVRRELMENVDLSEMLYYSLESNGSRYSVINSILIGSVQLTIKNDDGERIPLSDQDIEVLNSQLNLNLGRRYAEKNSYISKSDVVFAFGKDGEIVELILEKAILK